MCAFEFAYGNSRFPYDVAEIKSFVMANLYENAFLKKGMV